MATPAVAGCGAILLQDMRSFTPAQPDFMNSTLKAILIHTAVDLVGNECGSGYPCWSCTGSGGCSTSFVGPDYASGYGSVHLTNAVDFQRTKNIFEWTVDHGGSFSIPVKVKSTWNGPLKISLAWDDVPAEVVTNYEKPKLVNDLDLVVTDSANNRYYPWSMGGGTTPTPTVPSVRTQVNSIDNVEQVLIDTPSSSTTYTVTVQGTDVPEGPQTFSLCIGDVMGDSLYDPLCSHKGEITFKQIAYDCQGTAFIEVVDCDLNTSSTAANTVTVNVKSTSNQTGVNVTLTEIDVNEGRFIGSVAIASNNLQSCNGATLTATYVDADNGAGGYNVSVTATAVFSGPSCCEE